MLPSATVHSGLNQVLESVDQEAAPGMLILPGPGWLKSELYVFWYYIIINMVNEQEIKLIPYFF